MWQNINFRKTRMGEFAEVYKLKNKSRIQSNPACEIHMISNVGKVPHLSVFNNKLYQLYNAVEVISLLSWGPKQWSEMTGQEIFFFFIPFISELASCARCPKRLITALSPSPIIIYTFNFYSLPIVVKILLPHIYSSRSGCLIHNTPLNISDCLYTRRSEYLNNFVLILPGVSSIPLTDTDTVIQFSLQQLKIHPLYFPCGIPFIFPYLTKTYCTIA